jgi:hypothetical protein
VRINTFPKSLLPRRGGCEQKWSLNLSCTYFHPAAAAAAAAAAVHLIEMLKSKKDVTRNIVWLGSRSNGRLDHFLL